MQFETRGTGPDRKQPDTGKTVQIPITDDLAEVLLSRKQLHR